MLKAKALDQNATKWIYNLTGLAIDSIGNITCFMHDMNGHKHKIITSTLCYESPILNLYENDIICFANDSSLDSYIVKIMETNNNDKDLLFVLVSRKDFSVIDLSSINPQNIIKITNIYEKTRHVRW